MNRLAAETSPYLRQHRDNPVDWFPWGDEAFRLAREQDKPVLLSIGYAACHWCHVMAHESFEDPATAEVMNRLFVNVKVDREERPDVDAVYMQAVQAMTGHGGWPLTVFLAPDGRPFFGGTYFPKSPRHGMPGFVEVLAAVDEAWRTRRDELDAQASRLTEALGATARLRPSEGHLGAEILRAADEEVRARFDPQFGGFGGAPKFPQAMTVELLLRSHVRDRSAETLAMARLTLEAMAAGGMYDQVGGGFHRYSTDAAWLVPHFEKMLYDQALLARAFLHAWQVTGDHACRRVVEETIGYVLRDLAHPEGGFFSSEDADSEGEEGRFYVWSLDEIRDVCGDDAAEVADFFGATREGNFEGRNILHVARRGEARPEAVERALPELFEARRRRVRPGLDDKVLLAWNAMFLQTLAEASAVMGRRDWLEAARANGRFLLARLRRDDGRLLRSWQDGRAQHLAYSEDYAALLEALVTMAEVDDVAWLAEARAVADGLLDLFGDPEGGGFFTSGRDAEPLVANLKDVFDNATPSANSMAAVGLLRLWALTGDPRYEQPAVGVLRLLRDPLVEHPSGFAHLLGALEWHLSSPIEIAVVGEARDERTGALSAAAWRPFVPVSSRVTAPPGTGGELTPLLAGRRPPEPTAYVCEQFVCRQPVTAPEDLTSRIDEALASRSA